MPPAKEFGDCRDDASPGMSVEARRGGAGLVLLALGVVYGDIGTSPLYAVKETFNPSHGIPLTPGNVLGGVSAIFWALMVIVTLKYVVLVLRADNRGEGGIMALLALSMAAIGAQPRLAQVVLATGIIGAALFFGDAVLTPAISVLSAVEGLEVGTVAFKPYVLPIATAILIGLFLVQRQGTEVVGTLFGPVCLLWFLSLAVVGLWNISKNPTVLAALDPRHALQFVAGHGAASFLVLGSVLLAVTGAEALYADLGHFGKRAIRIAWGALVGPALVLNYFGQGALVLSRPSAIESPFFLSFPAWALYPMVALATAATVIASQATISGAFSLARQAIQLGLLPRMAIIHTSPSSMGQIYVPAVNWLLVVAVVGAVLGFGSSTNLASAYGIAVVGTMLATTILTFFVVTYLWRLPLWLCAAATAVFLIVDLAFLAATLHKIREGGWFPLLLAGAIAGLMVVWRGGRTSLLKQLRDAAIPLEGMLQSLFQSAPQRVPGTAVFLTSTPEATPHALLHSLKHYRVLHERNVFLHVEFRESPWIPFGDRVQCRKLGHDCWRVDVRYGFMNRPDIGAALALCGAQGLQLDPQEVSYFLSREKVVIGMRAKGRSTRWRDRVFAAMAQNAGSVTDFFRIPTNRVVELGTRVEI